ncbi:hypothetical protein [Limnohabitans lacus]|uniref:GspL cytoplasmic actin-ATPase-like domain-containing protein n=1 Tax=Limnohabitans lacus TaxID=3045173 RepID=A0ABT6XAT1_9BURK|nr:hypothetical protein [Limnohabitans sp. HM2-2]MDI9235186.1 hypothetical protein [Limnohabitans sp. HM2-2]
MNNSETSTGSSGDPSNTNPAGVSGVYCQSNAREAWWSLTEQLHLASTQPVTEPLPGTYISFAPAEDQSVLMDKAQSVLVKDIISDLGEPVFAQRYQPLSVPRSAPKSTRLDKGQAGTTGQGPAQAADGVLDSPLVRRLQSPWLYATTQARLDSLPQDVQMISGLAVLRGLLATSPSLQTLQAPFVTGVLFPGDAVQVLVLLVCSESGELSQMDYVPLAGLDPASAIRAYVQSVRLSASGEWTQERTAIFTADEILRLGMGAGGGSALRPYPREPQILGIPISNAWYWGSRVSTAALGLCGASLAGLTYLNQGLTAQLQDDQLQLQKQQQALTQMLSTDRLAAVLERRSVKADDAISKASAVWQEGAKVVIDAKSQTLKLTVSHKVQSTEQSPEQTPQALAKALSITPPEGCTRVPPSITPQISELYLTYECQTPDPALQRLLPAAR